MSIETTEYIWKHSPYKGGDLLVLLALANFANKDRVCWPSQTKIAERARITDRQLRTILHRLEHDGEILIERGRGRGRQAIYCVLSGLSEADREEKRKLFPVLTSGINFRSTQEKRKLPAGKPEVFTVEPEVFSEKAEVFYTENRKFTVCLDGGLAQQDASNPDTNRNIEPSYIEPSCECDPKTRARAPLDELAKTIASVCKINPALATRRQRDALNQSYRSLKAIGATPDAVRLRETWWHEHDWRARKEGRPPRPEELCEIWEMAASSPPAKPKEIDPLARPPLPYYQPGPSTPTNGALLKEIWDRVQAEKQQRDMQ